MTWIQTGPGTGRRRAAITTIAACVGAAGLWIWRSHASASLFIASLLATFLLMPRIARWATRKHVVALPGGRDIHMDATPRAGGVALFVPIAATLILLGVLGDPKAWGVLVGVTIVFACGLMDDVRGVRPLVKIACQLLAGVALLASGFSLEKIGFPGYGFVYLGAFEIPFVLFWVVLVTNAFNLSDGVDGLAASLAIMGMAVLVASGVHSLVLIAVSGACLSFLHYNMPKARIFLGDCGSLVLGFLIAAFALDIPPVRNGPVAFAAVAYSLGDVSLTILRRFVRGKPLFAPDSSHIHHKVVHYAGTPRRGLAVVLLFAGIQAWIGVMWPSVWTVVASVALWGLAAVILVRLGRVEASVVLRDRRPMQRLHVLRKDTARKLALAGSVREVESALNAFVERAGLCAIYLGDLAILNAAGCGGDEEEVSEGDERIGALTCVTEEPCERGEVRLRSGRGTWFAPPLVNGGALVRERETVVVGTLRQADACLRVISAAAAKVPARAASRTGESPA